MLIITGTGRCGTGYVSLVVTNTGATRCGHENLYNVNGRVKEPRFKTEADASWFAAPFVEDGDFVVHLVRNPIDCIESLVEVPDLFVEPRSPYGHFIAQHCPESVTDDPVISASRFYVLWNRRIEKLTDERWSVERLDPSRIASILSGQGFDVDTEAAQSSLDGLPHATKRADRPGPHLSWPQLRSILPADDFEALVRIAADYEYLRKRRLRVGASGKELIAAK